MKAVQVRALLLDALHQVLDNKVFRILVALAILPPLLTALVHFRSDEIVVLFGWKRIAYEELAWLAGGAADPQGVVVSALVALVIEGLTGTFGILICLIATAFFVPQMIEKGAADVLFHKPLTRFTLYLWRYVAGLLFVASIATLTCLGTFVGLALFSGHTDPGILAAIFTLTFGFGIAYAVVMLFGVLTKSAVASILCTLIFLFLNGCVVQESWVFKEYWADQARAELADEELDPAVEQALDPYLTISPWLRRAAQVCDVLHYTLPMSRDVELVGRELRLAAERYPYRDRDTGVTFFQLPDGAERRAADEAAGAVPATLADDFGSPRFALRFPQEACELTLHRRERRPDVRRSGERSRDAATALVERIGGDAKRTSGTIGAGTNGDPRPASIVRWSAGDRSHVAAVFLADDFLYALHWMHEGGLEDDELETARMRTDEAFGLWADQRGGSPWGQWYTQRAGFDAPARFNLRFSLLRSAAFVLVVLLLGWRRLSRMDF